MFMVLRDYYDLHNVGLMHLREELNSVSILVFTAKFSKAPAKKINTECLWLLMIDLQTFPFQYIKLQ